MARLMALKNGRPPWSGPSRSRQAGASQTGTRAGPEAWPVRYHRWERARPRRTRPESAGRPDEPAARGSHRSHSSEHLRPVSSRVIRLQPHLQLLMNDSAAVQGAKASETRRRPRRTARGEPGDFSLIFMSRRAANRPADPPISRSVLISRMSYSGITRAGVRTTPEVGKGGWTARQPARHAACRPSHAGPRPVATTRMASRQLGACRRRRPGAVRSERAGHVSRPPQSVVSRADG